MKKFLFAAFSLLVVLSLSGSMITQTAEEVPAKAADPVAAQEIATKGLEPVAENNRMILYADSRMGTVALYNKVNKFFWYSNPSEYFGQETLVGQEQVLTASQMEISYYDKRFLLSNDFSYTACVKKGGLTCKKTTDGVVFTYQFAAQGFTIPLKYTLNKDYMEVSIVMEDVKEEGDFTLGEIAVLPYFGSSTATEQGYILVPDGSGALIDFQNKSHSTYAYTQPIYGKDRTLSKMRETYNSETARMPVLGIHTGNTGLLCVVDKGAPMATANAQLANMQKKRNMGYFSFCYRPADWITMNTASLNARDVVAFAKTPSTTDAFALRYYPVEGNGEYFDMAMRYRQYLEEEKGLKKSNTPSDTQPLYVTSYGALEKQGSVLWIPANVIYPLTTYSQLGEMMDELKQSGIQNLISDYRGWYQGGYFGKLPVNGHLEKKLGSKSDFTSLLNHVKAENNHLFLGINLVDFYKAGNGYSKTNSVARTIVEAPALQFSFSLVNGYKNNQFKPWYLVSPMSYTKIMDKFVEKYPYDYSGISLGSAGSDLYSDFRKDGADRIKVQQYYVEAFQKAAQKGPVIADSVNSFLLPYVDHITGAPVECSNYDIESDRVPFYELVLHGYKSYSVPPINLSADSNKMFLYALEAGASLQYVFNYENFDEVNNTYLQSIYNSNYRDWKQEAAAYYQKQTEVYQKTKNSAIIGHTIPQDGVAQVKYDNGIVMIVNYTQETYKSDFGIVEPKSYGVFQGDAK